MKIKTGLFSGSFNPIHIGHLVLANYLCEYESLDELWFMVTPRNPLKKEEELLNDAKRVELVKLAIKGYPKFKVSDFESTLPQPSYTVNTLRALSTRYPTHNFTLIIGADNWNIFDKWKNYQEILENYSLLIYPRPGYPLERLPLPSNVKLTTSPLMEISSTFIRNAFRQGKDIRYYLHPEVFKKIKRENLYK